MLGTNGVPSSYGSVIIDSRMMRPTTKPLLSEQQSESWRWFGWLGFIVVGVVVVIGVKAGVVLWVGLQQEPQQQLRLGRTMNALLFSRLQQLSIVLPQPLRRSRTQSHSVRFIGEDKRSSASSTATLLEEETNEVEPVGDDPVGVVVRLDVYMEALCIDSQRFVVEQLVPAYQALSLDSSNSNGDSTNTNRIVDLHMIVFGNAELKMNEPDDAHHHHSRLVLQCQHGEAECDVNAYEQCVIHVLTSNNHTTAASSTGTGTAAVAVALDVIDCLFHDLPMGYRDTPFTATVLDQCAYHALIHNHHYPLIHANALVRRIRACHEDTDEDDSDVALQWRLQREAAMATQHIKSSQLQPNEHFHVPWIVIEGQHWTQHDPVSGMRRSLLEALCETYKTKESNNKNHPIHSACASTSLSLSSSLTTFLELE